MNRVRYLVLLSIALIVVVIGYLYLSRLADFPTAVARLQVSSGVTFVKRPSSAQEKVEPGNSTLLHNGETVQTGGSATLLISGGQVDLAPGTDFTLAQYGAAGTESQTEVILRAGQIHLTVPGYKDHRSYFRIKGPSGTILCQHGESITYIDQGNNLRTGVLSGTVNASNAGSSVNIAENQGTSIAKEQPPQKPAAWSRVVVQTYRPDGSAVKLPVTLSSNTSDLIANLQSNDLTMLPEGSYRLRVDAVKPYEVSDLTLSAATLNEVTITLSEVLFVTTTVDGKPAAYSALNVQGDSMGRALPDTPVLISPGKWTLMAAREEKPEKIQPVTLDLLPGQRVTVPLRNDLFGGGAVQVHVTAPDGTTAAPVTVAVYSPGTENSQPLLTFKSDSGPQSLPAGQYIISVRTLISARFEITVIQGDTMNLQVPLGNMAVDYQDAQGRSLTGGMIAYVAVSTEMQRLGLSIDQMRQTPYGVAVNAGTTLLIPAGIYNIQADDGKKTTGQQNVHVDAGKTVAVELRASP